MKLAIYVLTERVKDVRRFRLPDVIPAAAVVDLGVT
jgi:hypothetical protein